MTDPLDALAQTKRMDRAYAQVFGPEGQRSAQQAAVWQELEQLGFETRPFVPPVVDAPIDPLRVVYNEGKRTVFLHIKERIRRATAPEETNTPTVKKD